MNQFGQALQYERRRRSISQHRLAGATETTQRHLSFLETGRSAPTRQMIMRLCEALELPPGSRSNLFSAAGFTSPYRLRDLDDVAIQETLKMLERFVLANWPYPAFAMTGTWDVLLANRLGAAMFGQTREQIKSCTPNMFDLVLDENFRSRVSNWPEVSAALYARMHAHAVNNPAFEIKLKDALASGAIASDLAPLATKAEIPVLLPMEFCYEDGTCHRITSLTAQFTSAHDQIISGIEIELMVPLDDITDRSIRAKGQSPV